MPGHRGTPEADNSTHFRLITQQKVFYGLRGRYQVGIPYPYMLL